MFDYDIAMRKHYSGKDGETTYIDWQSKMGISNEDFPFKVKTNKFTKTGKPSYMNVVSWGFYQGSDWRYYVFITYRESVGKYTCAYHWDTDYNGLPVGLPRKYEWVN